MSWTGSVTITGTGSGTVSFAGGHTNYDISQSITPALVLKAKTGAFLGPQNAVVNVNETFVTYFDGVPESRLNSLWATKTGNSGHTESVTCD